MNSLFDFIALLCILGAIAAVVVAIRNPEHRHNLYFAALGVLLAIPVTKSLGEENGRRPDRADETTGGSAESSQRVVETSPWETGQPYVAERDSRTGRSTIPLPETSDRDLHKSRSSVAPVAAGEEPVVREEVGGTEVAVAGSWDPSSVEDVEVALLSALENQGWTGLTRGGQKRLTISGSIRDLDLILGQLNAASVSARWELRSRSGEVLAQGAASDIRGKGVDANDARLTAIGRAASEIAQQIVQRAP